MKTKEIINKSLKSSMSYKEYRGLIDSLLLDNKSTSENNNVDLYNYSILNAKRMSRLDKTIRIDIDFENKIKSIANKVTLLVISEGWCGDAAHILPVLNKISELNKNISYRIVLRDKNEELMNNFLTNGSKSIPIVVALDSDKNVLFKWGPRPSIATKIIEDYKSKNGCVDKEIKKDLQIWYNKNKGKNITEDIINSISKHDFLLR